MIGNQHAALSGAVLTVAFLIIVLVLLKSHIKVTVTEVLSFVDVCLSV